MLTHRNIVVVLLIFSVWLAACNSSNPIAPSPAEAGGASAAATGGEQLFQENGCIACHTVSAGANTLVGPSLVDLVGQSQAIIESPGYTGSADSVEGYIRESILTPEVYLVEGFPPVMPSYEPTLSQEELDAIVAYLLTLD